MWIFRYIIVSFLLGVPAIGTFAQQCKGFYKSSRCFVRDSKEFKQYGQARSAAVEVGETYRLNAILYGQKDFIVSVCAEQGYKPLHFRIINTENKEVLYDNADDSYNLYVGFAVEKTKSVVVELTILTDKVENKDPTHDRVCIGVQIVWRKIPRLGFGKDEAEGEPNNNEKK